MTSPEVIAHLLKQGGKVLLVGGETKDLPRVYQDHPQILIWDDNQQDCLQKTIPMNVKVIMYNRWISHSMVGRLNEAAKSLHALKFPMLRTREIKSLLAEVVQVDAPEVVTQEVTQEVERKIEEGLQEQPELEKTEVATKKPHSGGRKGHLNDFIAKHINLDIDYTKKGTILQEGKRILAIAEKEKFKTTIGSLTNTIGSMVKNLRKGKTTFSPTPRISDKTTNITKKDMDDFEELEHLIEDAIIAMKLVQEHLPKVRKETSRLRGMREKMLKLIGGDE